MAIVNERRASGIWGGAFVLGILLVILGIVALSYAIFTSVASVVLFGLMLAAAGIVEIGHAIRSRGKGEHSGALLGGILSAVVGVLIAARPGAGLAAVTLLLIGFFFASGLFRAVTSVFDRYPQWGWDFAYGVLAIVLGFMLTASFPASALWLVGTLVGIEIIFRGIALMAGALAVRQVVRGPHEVRA